MLRADVTLTRRERRAVGDRLGDRDRRRLRDGRLGSADIDGEARDLFTAPQIEGEFSIRDLTAGGLVICAPTGAPSARATRRCSTSMRSLPTGASRWRDLEPRGEGLAIALQDFVYARPGIDLTLAAPTTIVVGERHRRIRLHAAERRRRHRIVSGRAGAALDLDVG